MKLKETCEDFLVEEIINEQLIVQEPTSFHLYLLEKRNYTTERAISHIANALHIPRKRISYAGTKDKQAITKQLICIQGVQKERVEKIELKDIQLHFAGYAKEKLGLGDLRGNKFTIVLRDLDLSSFENVPEAFFVPNYFDDQRFSQANVHVGLHLLKKEFKEATLLVMETDQDFNAPMQAHLDKQENDYLGALRLLPKKTLLFFVHSIQSYIFNELLSAQLRAKGAITEVAYSQGQLAFPKTILTETTSKTLPLVGFDSQLNEAEEKILEAVGIEQRDFLIKSIPELTLEGSERQAYMHVEDVHIGELEADEMHAGKKKITITFNLSKGSYATIVVKQIFASQ